MDWKDEIRKTIYGQLPEEEQSEYRNSLYQTGEAQQAERLFSANQDTDRKSADLPVWEKTAAAAEEEIFFAEEDIVSAVRAIANLAEASEREKTAADVKKTSTDTIRPAGESSRDTSEPNLSATVPKYFATESRNPAVQIKQGATESLHSEREDKQDVSLSAREWLYKENLRLEGLREEVAKAGKMMQAQAAALKEEELKLEADKELFEKEKEEFKKEMKDWNEQIKQSKRKLAEEQGLFEKKYKVLEMGFAKLSADKKELEAQKRAFEYRKRFLSDAEEFASVDMANSRVGGELLFFKGANHPLAVKKRYKELIKIYHPDNTDGDKMILQRINQEYDRIRRAQQ